MDRLLLCFSIMLASTASVADDAASDPARILQQQFIVVDQGLQAAGDALDEPPDLFLSNPLLVSHQSGAIRVEYANRLDAPASCKAHAIRGPPGPLE